MFPLYVQQKIADQALVTSEDHADPTPFGPRCCMACAITMLSRVHAAHRSLAARASYMQVVLNLARKAYSLFSGCRRVSGVQFAMQKDAAFKSVDTSV